MIMFAEGAAEISRVRKSCLKGDRRDRFVCTCKQVGGAFEPVLYEISDGGEPNALTEKLQRATLADMDALRNVFQCDRLFIICVDELHHHL